VQAFLQGAEAGKVARHLGQPQDEPFQPCGPHAIDGDGIDYLQDGSAHIAAYEAAHVRAVEVLREQLEHERARSERFERRIDSLQAELSAANRRLLEVLTGPRVTWWRRWFR
jgi:hypothetical protein